MLFAGRHIRHWRQRQSPRRQSHRQETGEKLCKHTGCELERERMKQKITLRKQNKNTCICQSLHLLLCSGGSSLLIPAGGQEASNGAEGAGNVSAPFQAHGDQGSLPRAGKRQTLFQPQTGRAPPQPLGRPWIFRAPQLSFPGARKARRERGWLYCGHTAPTRAELLGAVTGAVGMGKTRDVVHVDFSNAFKTPISITSAKTSPC